MRMALFLQIILSSIQPPALTGQSGRLVCVILIRLPFNLEQGECSSTTWARARGKRSMTELRALITAGPFAREHARRQTQTSEIRSFNTATEALRPPGALLSAQPFTTHR